MWTVQWYDGEFRKRKQFATQEEAERFAGRLRSSPWASLRNVDVFAPWSY